MDQSFYMCVFCAPSKKSICFFPTCKNDSLEADMRLDLYHMLLFGLITIQFDCGGNGFMQLFCFFLALTRRPSLERGACCSQSGAKTKQHPPPPSRHTYITTDCIRSRYTQQ
jgi:hypothetical protein